MRPNVRPAARLALWVAGLAGTVAWTWLLDQHTPLPMPAVLALGAIGIVLTVWSDAVVFPAPRPVEPPSAPGRLTREVALQEATRWSVERAVTAPRPVGRSRGAGKAGVVTAPATPPVTDPPAAELSPLLASAMAEARRIAGPVAPGSTGGVGSTAEAMRRIG